MTGKQSLDDLTETKKKNRNRIRKKLTANELLDLISYQWANSKDIQNIGYISYNQALETRRKIAEECNKEEIICPKYEVPMKKVVEYFKIDINYLRKVRGNK